MDIKKDSLPQLCAQETKSLTGINRVRAMNNCIAQKSMKQ